MTSLIFDILHPPIRGQQFALELIRQPMRPRDLNQWAKRMVDIAKSLLHPVTKRGLASVHIDRDKHSIFAVKRPGMWLVR
jgi:hypothetical protein